MRYPFAVTLAAVVAIACSRSGEKQATQIPPERVHLVARVPVDSSTPLPLTREMTLPVLIHNVEPTLPPSERARIRQQPFMLFELTIDQHGNVVNIKTLRSNDATLLPYVTAAIRQWKYRPATLGGKPVTILYTVTFTYEVR